MIKEYVVKITDGVIPDAFARFEEEYSPEQELVRCKDCKHWDADAHECNIKTGWFACGAEWFCADGERRDDDA